MPITPRVAVILGTIAALFSIAVVSFSHALEPFIQSPAIWFGIFLITIGLIPIAIKFRFILVFWWILILSGAIIIIVALTFS